MAVMRTGRKYKMVKGRLRPSFNTKGLSKPAAKAVARIARRVVNRKAETKWAAHVAEGPTVLSGDIYPIGGQPQVFPAICPVVNGTADYERVGNEIHPVRVGADLFLSLAQSPITGGTTQDNSWDITAHIWYGYVKRFKSATDVVTNNAQIANNLLDLGGSGATDYQRFTGLMQDMMYPTNREYFTNLKHKSVRLFKSYGSANTNPALAAGVTQYFPDRVSSMVKLSFKAPKTLKYVLADEPENYCPVVIVGYQHNDATQAANGNVGTPILAFEMITKIWYKDE